ncbi:MAG TPA: HEPN-associated N-terminal domain-containing protein [Mucilaginibacter sp.]|nr:HEPN-associated N-terminal domain-containing protein [Mucilaginibacter sp.]
MSLVMEEAQEHWDRGLSSVPDTYVCSSHIDDYAIKLFIRRNGEKLQCDYCKKYRNVVQLEQLMYFLTDALLHFFTDPANFMSYESAEGGYLGDYDGPWEMLESLGLEVADEKLYEDIFESLDHSSAWSDEGVKKSDFKYEAWRHFSYFVKHQSRYLFSCMETLRVGARRATAEGFIKEIASDIRHQRMLATVPAGTSIYRCRQHPHPNDVRRAADICSPKVEFAIYPNRMSAAGVPMFYGAFEPKTAMLETLRDDDHTKPYYTIAEFACKEDLHLIDLSKIPYISPFDQENWELFDRLSFLHKFLDDFSKPVAHDGKEHIEYVPTQVITEYFRHKFYRNGKKPIDGIIYPSSKNRKLNACVLFMDHYECLDRMNLKSDLTTYNLKPAGK